MFVCVFLKQISNGTSSVIVSRKRPSEGNYQKEKDLCIKYFDQWSESDQVEFVEHLISRMCHYQHGHINSYLKPMLQRDFITALPGNSPVSPVEGRPAQELAALSRRLWEERMKGDSARQHLWDPVCSPLWHLETSSDLASLGREGSVCDEWCGSWSTVCFLEPV